MNTPLKKMTSNYSQINRRQKNQITVDGRHNLLAQTLGIVGGSRPRTQMLSKRKSNGPPKIITGATHADTVSIKFP
jgi:hypothetical protein